MTSTTTTPAPLSHFLTQVESVYIQDRLNYRLLFGHPVRVIENEFVYGERTRKTSYFQPGEIFGIDLWQRNDYGTSAWTVYVLQAAEPGEDAMPVPQVKPAVKVLLGRVKGVRTLILSSACPGGEAIELFQDARRFRESNPPNHMADHE